MKYVYILESLSFPGRFYVGVTGDLRARLKKHNAGEVMHNPSICLGNSGPTSPSRMTNGLTNLSHT
jgi:hypothetical protein